MIRVVGVVALQGGFAAHVEVLRSLGFEARRLRRPEDLGGETPVEGLVLPGGESTAQAKLLRSSGLWSALDARVRAGCPVLATCAGLILAARRIVHVALPGAQRDEGWDPPTFGWLDVAVARNGYGRQLDSCRATSDDGARELVFIRAPRLVELGPSVQVLARYRGEAVAVRQGAIVGAAYHPELVPDPGLHALAFASRAHSAQSVHSQKTVRPIPKLDPFS